MEYPYCARFGLNSSAIENRLRLLELDKPAANARGCELQNAVIGPNATAIVDDFYGSLATIAEFNQFLDRPSTAARLRSRQHEYLLRLGLDFNTREYFEERLRVGVVHQRIGVPHSLYQCTFQHLQCLIIDHIPQSIHHDQQAFDAMLRFILRITALDMSLAVESYCMATVFDLTQSLASERDKIDKLRELTVTDWLTNLRNQSYSRRCIETLLEQSAAAGEPLCVIMADLDHFKAINDLHGHLVGDEVLKIAAARMVAGARQNDEVCRYGGEEFLLILRNTDIDEGWDVAERVRAKIGADAIHAGEGEIAVTLSLGLAEATPSDTVNSLIDRADAALYAAKAAGRNCTRRKALVETDPPAAQTR